MRPEIEKSTAPTIEDENERRNNLSAQELAVVHGILAGLAIKEIASQLTISVPAVGTYLARAKSKLGQISRWKLSVALSLPLPSVRELVEPTSYADLAEPEVAIAEALLKGASNAEIADEMRVPVHQIVRRVATLLRRTGFKTRSELLARATALAAERGQRACSKNIPRAGDVDASIMRRRKGDGA